MKRIFFLLAFAFVLNLIITGCSPTSEQVSTAVADAVNSTTKASTPTTKSSVAPTEIVTSSSTPTETLTLTETMTPTETLTPSLTSTPTITLTPTFELPTFTVKVQAHCRYGPAKAYLHAGDLYPGDTGKVWGVDKMGRAWLYVKMDKYKYPCYVAKSTIDVQGDLNTIVAAPPLYLPKSTLYGPIQRVNASRKGNEVIVNWEKVWMTEDDDRGYFIEGWFCQNGAYFWSAVAIPNQFVTTYTFTDESGCAAPSSAKIYVVEKHGYTKPVDIPWPTP
jgi:hypothetical protein